MLSHRFDDALVFCSNLHRDQHRKGTDVPAIAHVLSVAALALEYEADEDCAIAALLHDAVKSHDRAETVAAITDRFGMRVAEIVQECSDPDAGPDACQEELLPWRQRKASDLDALPAKSMDAILVISCEILHDTTVILEALVADGLSVSNRLNGSKTDVIQYYRTLADALQQVMPGPLTARVSKTVSHIEYWVNVND